MRGHRLLVCVKDKIDRGIASEEYVFENGRAEQLFIIPNPLGATGVLRVVIAVETDLDGPVTELPRSTEGRLRAGGLVFSDAEGKTKISYHTAVALDAPRVEAGLVRRFADLLRRETRATDRIARLGPARFAILLPETTEVGATQLVERLQARTADWSNGTPGVVVGAGWASPRRGETLREAMAKAEARLVGNAPPTDRKPRVLDTL